jgi:oligopeptide transport system ATP-binding protein
MSEQPVLVEVRDLRKCFPVTRGIVFSRRVGEVKAVDGVSFQIRRGETLGLVGESGSGKTTVGRALLRLHEPSSGQILLEGEDFLAVSGQRLRVLRRRMQMIFQDPYASINPRLTVGEIVAEPLEVGGGLGRAEIRARVDELLDLVGLDPAARGRYPHEFSGGQRQRIGIARALALSPDLIVCDEAIASLDVSIQAQIVNLLEALQAQFGFAYLFIAHDLSMVRHISDRIAVMYLGKIMESGPAEDVFGAPLHPYTKALMSAVPVPDPEVEAARERIILAGDIPSPANPPRGCVFSTRCPVAMEVCSRTAPEYREVKAGHFAACYRADEAAGERAS